MYIKKDLNVYGANLKKLKLGITSFFNVIRQKRLLH